MQFNVHEAKTNFSKLLDRALEGEDVVICRQGHAIVRLTPIRLPAGRLLGQGKGEFPLPETGWQGPLSSEDMADLTAEL